MRIHKEGYLIILMFFIILGGLCALFFTILPKWIASVLLVAAIIFFGLIVQFFRAPKRDIPLPGDELIYAPADGKIVVIEQTLEGEYYKKDRIQVSIFMSPLNVHINRIPFSGKVAYHQYHPGKYLVAWHPKSSIENERSTTVISGAFGSVLLRQIAGAVARRIKTYTKTGDLVTQGAEFGFIKFGSRVDLFLPLDAEIKVQLDQKVKGNQTIIAQFKAKQ